DFRLSRISFGAPSCGQPLTALIRSHALRRHDDIRQQPIETACEQEGHMNRLASALSLLLGLALTTQAMAQGTQAAITEQEAQATGIDASVSLYPLVTMDVTRKQFTNVKPGKEPGHGPMNMFNNLPSYPPADLKVVVRPNFDTLYSVAYLDLTK